MTEFPDVKRQWDGLESTPLGKVLQFPTKSAVRIANVLPHSPRWSREDVRTVATWVGLAVVIFALAVGARVL